MNVNSELENRNWIVSSDMVFFEILHSTREITWIRRDTVISQVREIVFNLVAAKVFVVM